MPGTWPGILEGNCHIPARGASYNPRGCASSGGALTTFRIGRHDVKVWRELGRWGVAVDDSVSRNWFMTEAQAAGAGLIRVERLRAVARMRALAAASGEARRVRAA